MRPLATVIAVLATTLVLLWGPGCTLLDRGTTDDLPEPPEQPDFPRRAAAMAEADRDGDLSAPATTMEGLRIQSGPGPLVVTGDPKRTRLDVHWRVTTWASTMAEAHRLREETRVHLKNRDSNRPLLEVQAPRISGSDQRWSVSLKVRVPARLKLVVSDSEGDITVTGIQGGTQISNAEGAVLVHGTAGGVYLSNGGGPTQISEVTGKVTIDDGPGDITVSTITGDVEIRSGGGSLEIYNIDGNVIARDLADGVTVEYIEGDLELWDIVPSAARIKDVSGSLGFKKSKQR